MTYEVPNSAIVIRWGARILSVLILIFWGIFLVADFLFSGFVRSHEASPRPLVASDYAIPALLVASLAGLALSWKWESAGAVVTLVAIVCCATMNWKVVLFPGTLIPITAILYLLSWWVRRGMRVKNALHHPAG